MVVGLRRGGRLTHVFAGGYFAGGASENLRTAGDWRWSSARAHLAGRDDRLVVVSPLLERCAGRFADLIEQARTPPQSPPCARSRRAAIRGRASAGARSGRRLEGSGRGFSQVLGKEACVTDSDFPPISPHRSLARGVDRTAAYRASASRGDARHPGRHAVSRHAGGSRRFDAGNAILA